MTAGVPGPGDRLAAAAAGVIRERWVRMPAAAVVLGSGLGGVWTSDRVFMLRLSPPDKIGEFFGLYGLAGKFSAVTGPILYGSVVSTLLNAGWGKASYQVGIFSFLILMVIGVALLRGVPDRRTEDGSAIEELEVTLAPGPG